METIISEQLDTDEILHCALAASEQKDHEQAIRLFKQYLMQSPDGKGYLLLAAEHAEIGLYQRAIAEMKQAITLDSSLWIAHFQLSLLYLIEQDIAQASTIWQQLMLSDAPQYFHYFAEGLLLIHQDQLAEGIGKLKQGIELNNENLPLNNDINNIIQEVESGKPAAVQLEQDALTTDNEQNNDTNPSLNYLLLSRYNQDD
ncbi:tetratricopeptide repeat protein [Spartinivicinus ruber]|uniref:tetratricopeptide repeat protein n=1 Tax=Spartinivicinus ruber TaxID=2683272 RepID=UPI0013D04467|nr:hypothetical protein [Spartinivicinus ruber]